MMKKTGILVLLAILFLGACGNTQPESGIETVPSEQSARPEQSIQPEQSVQPEHAAATEVQEESEGEQMRMKIGGTAVTVQWEDNEAVRALGQLAAGSALTVQMSMYGGFEQVGAIGQSLPRKDARTTTQAGDIVLYSGDQLVVFYGSNTWAYTRLGRITGKSDAELERLLGNGDVVITIEAGE